MRRRLRPGSYAIVMATGIVSLALASAGRPVLSDVLFSLSVAAYVLLLLGVRPERELSLFAFTAAGDVIAARAAAEGWKAVALGLWTADAVAWIAFGVWLLRGLPRRRDARGEWLLAVVATESLALVAGLLPLPGGRFVGLSLFAFGLALYPVVVSLLARRLRRLVRRDERLAGDDWILLGALAISSLAAEHVGAPHALALALWAAALAWAPALVAGELASFPPARDGRRWSTVFPLGMFAVASYAVGVPAVGAVATWIAAAAWAATGLAAAASARGSAVRQVVRRKPSA